MRIRDQVQRFMAEHVEPREREFKEITERDGIFPPPFLEGLKAKARAQGLWNLYPEIEITSDTTARGIWAMEDMLRWEEGSGSPIKSLHGYGHYIETYERINGRWCIKTWKLKRLSVDVK